MAHPENATKNDAINQLLISAGAKPERIPQIKIKVGSHFETPQDIITYQALMGEIPVYAGPSNQTLPQEIA